MAAKNSSEYRVSGLNMSTEKSEHRGFNKSFSAIVDQLITPVKIVPVSVANDKTPGAPVEFRALWDTGATVTCVSLKVRDKLTLLPAKPNTTSTLSGFIGGASADLTYVHIFPSDDMELELCSVYMADFDDEEFDIIIGMDIISTGDFAVCNADGKTSFSFAVPPFPDRIDLTDKAKTANKQNT